MTNKPEIPYTFLTWYCSQNSCLDDSFLDKMWKIHLKKNPNDNKCFRKYMFARTLYKKMRLIFL